MAHRRTFLSPTALWGAQIAGLSLLLMTVVLLALQGGAVELPPFGWWDLITGHGRQTTWGMILMEVRLPRILLAALAGAGLSAAGLTWQGILRNPLADPYLIGVSAGAALGAGVAMVAGERWALASGLMPAFAFVGALGAVLLVVLLTGARQGLERLLLAGVAVSSLLSALLSMLLVWHSESLTALYLWMLGGFNGREWADLGAILPYLAIGIGLIISQLSNLHVLQLGAERAHSLGVNPKRSQMVLMAGAALITAALVSVCGMIGFVGLVVPHLTRMLAGPDPRRTLPLACLMGACLMVGADMAARTWWAPAEMPVGVLTALLGAPFFLYLVAKDRSC